MTSDLYAADKTRPERMGMYRRILYPLLPCSPFFLYLPASSFTLTSWDDKTNATQRCCWRKKIISACYIALLSGAVKLSERMKANQFGSCCEASNNTKHIVHCSMNTVHVNTVDIIAAKFLHWLRLEQLGMARLLSNPSTVLPALVCPFYQHQWLACPPTLHSWSTSTSGH